MITSVPNLDLANNIAQIVPEYTQEEITAFLSESKTESDPPYVFIGLATTVFILIIVTLLLRRRLHRR